MTTGATGLPPEGAVLNFVVRMVVPMRREFGRSLDVQRFLQEPDYARAVLEQALASRDQRLRDYAEYVKRHTGGAREVDAPRLPPHPAAVPPQPAAEPASDDTVPAALDAGPDAAAALPPQPTEAAQPAEAAHATKPAEAAEAELRARLLKKYTGGLR